MSIEASKLFRLSVNISTLPQALLISLALLLGSTPLVATVHANSLAKCISDKVDEDRLATPEEKRAIKLADSGPRTKRAERRLKQITGNKRRKGQNTQWTMEIPDPSIAKMRDGSVRIYGSGKFYLEYKTENDFLRAGKYRRVELDLRYPDMSKLQGPYHTGELPWDFSYVRWPDGTEVIYGGAMTPPAARPGAKKGARKHAKNTIDNFTRSGHAFVKKVHKGKEVWVRHDVDIFGELSKTNETWVGHNYGRRVLTEPNGDVWRDQKGDAWVFYEKVTKDPGQPFKTEIYAKRMKNHLVTYGDEIKILAQPKDFYQSTRKDFLDFGSKVIENFYLMEGANPNKIKIGKKLFHFFGFASGDWPTDKYATNVAFREDGPIGNYTPITKMVNGKPDLVDFGARIKKKYGLSWMGRPEFFQDEHGQWWVLFHGIDVELLAPGLDGNTAPNDETKEKFHRNVYLAPVEFSELSDGSMWIEIFD